MSGGGRGGRPSQSGFVISVKEVTFYPAFVCLSVYLSASNSPRKTADCMTVFFIYVSLDEVVPVKFRKSYGLRIHTWRECSYYTSAVKSDICLRRFLLYSKETVDRIWRRCDKSEGYGTLHSEKVHVPPYLKEMTFRWRPV